MRCVALEVFASYAQAKKSLLAKRRSAVVPFRACCGAVILRQSRLCPRHLGNAGTVNHNRSATICARSRQTQRPRQSRRSPECRRARRCVAAAPEASCPCPAREIDCFVSGNNVKAPLEPAPAACARHRHSLCWHGPALRPSPSILLASEAQPLSGSRDQAADPPPPSPRDVPPAVAWWCRYRQVMRQPCNGEKADGAVRCLRHN